MTFKIFTTIFISTFVAQASAVEIMREAESANSIKSPLKVHEKSTASGGKYLNSNKDSSGEAAFDISISQAGEYTLSARVKAPDGSKNSYNVSIDGGSSKTWHFPESNSYQWVNFGSKLNLSAGKHRIVFKVREAYTELDAIKLVSGTVAPQQPQEPKPQPQQPEPQQPQPQQPQPQEPQQPQPQEPVSGLDPNRAPAQNFDLSLWKVTLPIDSSGGNSGTAIEIKPITATYQKAPYFYTGSDGALVFSAPANGATTSGSKYPRSELREMTQGYQNAAWTVEEGGTLSATLAVNELPVTSSGGKGRVVIGQIHGPNDELCRLYYDNGRLYFYDDKAGSSQKETQFVLKSSAGAEANIPLNAKFSYTIKATRSELVVSAVYNGVTYSARDPISSFWPGKALYFKAGIYVQVGKPGSGAGTTGTGQGKVSFYKLSKPSHP